jgi:hypothetical protein
MPVTAPLSNSEFEAEYRNWSSGTPFCIFNILSVYEELVPPIAHVRGRECISTVSLEQLDMALPALQTLASANYDEKLCPI